MDMPLTIRILEYTRERLTTDVEVHKLAKALACLAASAASFSSHSYDNFIQARDQFKAALHSLFNIEQI